MKKSLIAAAIAAASLAPAAATAQEAAATATAAAPAVGAKVFDPQGSEVGTVEAVQGDVITVSTGATRAGLPKSAFAMRENGLTIGMTKAQLEEAVNGASAQTNASKDAALVAQAPVKSSDGVVLGKITKVEGDNVTLTLNDGAAVALKKSYIGVGADSSLAVGMTAADFAKATQAAAGSAQASADAAAPASSGQENAATEQQ